MARRHHLGLEALGQRVGPEIGDAGDFLQRHTLGAVGAVDDLAAADVERPGFGLQQGAGDVEDVAAQCLGGLQRGLAGDAGAARTARAPADRHVVGVAGDYPDAIGRGAEGRGGDLADDGLRTLALLGDAGLDDHRS